MMTTTATQVYELYIRATPERVWDAITKPEFIEKYFHGAHHESTYEVGSSIRSWSPDRAKLWGDNVVLETRSQSLKLCTIDGADIHQYHAKIDQLCDGAMQDMQ